MKKFGAYRPPFTTFASYKFLTHTIMYQEERTGSCGRIEVICGSMFSGKTEELIRRLKRARFAKQRVEIFKPAIDTHYSDADVVSHDANAIASTPIDSASSLLLLASEAQVVGLDEAQFFLTMHCPKFAKNWPKAASASSWPAWTWTSKAYPSAPCPR